MSKVNKNSTKTRTFLPRSWSQYDKDRDKLKIEVTSYLEAFFIFCVFAFILIVLYPKDMLREQVLSESSNYDLTATYLENMLKLEPDNVDLLIPMAKVSLQRHNYDLSEKILKALRVIPEKKVQVEVYSLEYNLLDIRKNSSEDNATIDKYREKMVSLINKMANENMFKKEDIPKWYHEAISLGEKEAALKIIRPLYKEDKDLYWLEQALYLSTELKNEVEKRFCANTLAEMDVEHNEKWLKTAYEVSIENGSIGESLSYIAQLAKINTKYKDEQARIELLAGSYKRSSDIYMQLHNESRSKREKAKYFLKALRSLQHGNLLDEVVKLAQKYEDEYISDKRISSEIIKIYLASGKIEEAKRYSLKILDREENR
jgi:hypothetical protein